MRHGALHLGNSEGRPRQPVALPGGGRVRRSIAIIRSVRSTLCSPCRDRMDRTIGIKRSEALHAERTDFSSLRSGAPVPPTRSSASLAAAGCRASSSPAKRDSNRKVVVKLLSPELAAGSPSSGSSARSGSPRRCSKRRASADGYRHAGRQRRVAEKGPRLSRQRGLRESCASDFLVFICSMSSLTQ